MSSYLIERKPGSIDGLDLDLQRKALRQLYHVSKFSLLASALGTLFGVVPFAYLALAEPLPSIDNPNPQKMDPFSQWMSIFFHAALFFHAGGVVFEWLKSLYLERLDHPFFSAYQKIVKDPKLRTLLKELSWIFLYLAGCYCSSLFAFMPTIALVRAATFAGTPSFFLHSFFVLQFLFLWTEVRTFGTKLYIWLKEKLQKDAVTIARDADLKMIQRLIDWISAQSMNRKEYRSTLLKLMLGGKWSETTLLPGLLENQKPHHSIDLWEGLRDASGQRTYYLRDNPGGIVYKVLQEVLDAGYLIDQEIQEEIVFVSTSTFKRIISFCLKWVLRFATVLLCALYVTPQSVLAGDAMKDDLSENFVGYLNLFHLRPTTVGFIFDLGLTVFFFNFITQFIEQVMSKHFKMIYQDLREVGWTWKWKPYVRAIFNQHILMFLSIAIGLFSIPPFQYIFEAGLQAIKTADDLKDLAKWMCDFLSLLKSFHGLIIYYNAFLVASTCHTLFKRFVNYIQGKMDLYPEAQMREMLLKWLEELGIGVMKQTVLKPLHQTEVSPTLGLATVYFAAKVRAADLQKLQADKKTGLPYQALFAAYEYA